MRNNYWDLCKGISIVAVVVIHAAGILSGHSSDDFRTITGIVLRQFINFAVPVFLFISGYFAFNNKPKANLVKTRLVRVIIPYLCCSLLYILSDFITKGKIYSLYDLTEALLLGKAMIVGYFVIVIIQFIIITPAIMMIDREKNHVLLMILITSLGLGYTYITKLYFPQSSFATFPISAIPFFIWYPFFHLGFYLSRYQKTIPLRNIIFPLLLLLAITEGLFLYKISGYEFATSQVKLSSFLLSICICAFIYNNKNANIKKNIFTFFGVNSYPIYLLHMLFLPRATTLTTKLNITEEHPILSIALITLITLLLSAFVTLCVQKLLPKHSRYIIG
ncbi:acyltransferase [Klebsiella pasteurii]|uniref:acyltransferase n=1 Tax=Klebsiella pasteurii TaxID=2587529 RepID=UPI00115EF5CE|nr:acyltransferase [Klebsiella pasteurii]VUS33948.1 O-acetyltransferase WecH [Klebsiella pasteurii]